MVLKAKLLLGLAAAGMGTAMLALKGNEAKAGGDSSRGKNTPSGADPGRLADRTTALLLSQDIVGLRQIVAEWATAGDPLTSSALSFTLESAVKSEKLEEWPGDGQKGSPLLRAFGERVFLLEGRPEKLRLWSESWADDLPVLSAALRAKADGIKISPDKGTTDDPTPDEATLKRIIDAVSKGDPAELRRLADELDRAGFDAQADDLRAMADLIDAGKAKPPAPSPSPSPTPGPSPAPRPSPAPSPVPEPDAPLPPAPSPVVARTTIVQSGDGFIRIMRRLLGPTVPESRWHELRDRNVPVDADGRKRAKATDTAGGISPKLQPGQKLFIPENWILVSPNPAPAPLPPVPGPTGPTGPRTETVRPGDGFIRIMRRLLGPSVPESRWRELRDRNVPVDADGRLRAKATDAAGGISPKLQPGQKLFVPESWLPILIQGDGSEPANARQVRAGKIALAAHRGSIHPDVMSEWQLREGLHQTGCYDLPSAMVLCFRFGLVPPPPHFFENPKQREKFATQMIAAARRDPQRADEYKFSAQRAMGGH